MSSQSSISTPIQKPSMAKTHHLAKGICDAADDVVEAAGNVAFVAFVGTCVATGLPSGAAVAHLSIAGLVGAAATIGLAHVFGKAARYVKDSTNMYEGDVSNEVASTFNQRGRIIAWVAPLALVAASGVFASQQLHKLPQAAPQTAMTAQPEMIAKPR